MSQNMSQNMVPDKLLSQKLGSHMAPVGAVLFLLFAPLGVAVSTINTTHNARRMMRTTPA
jgi:cell division protein FtsL